MRERARLIVEVDLDPFPGAMHDAESARYHIACILQTQVNHYNPRVQLASNQPAPQLDTHL